jgi:hypothetical protein
MTEQELMLRGFISTLPVKKQRKITSLSKELIKHIESTIKENGETGAIAASLATFSIVQMIEDANKKTAADAAAEQVKGEE